MKKIINISVIFLYISSFVIGQNAGDYQSAKSGKWKMKSTWNVYDGSNWISASDYPNDATKDVYILDGNIIDYNVSVKNGINNLYVDNGGSIYSNSPKNLKIFGNIICDGNIGNISSINSLLFYIESNSCTISGSGTFGIQLIYKTTNTNATTELIIDMDVLLWGGDKKSILNKKNGTNLNITINPNANLTCLTDINLNRSSLLIKCDETGYGSLICKNIINSDSANTTIERYIAKDQWHYISSPVKQCSTYTFFDIYLKYFDENEGTWHYIINEDSLLVTDMMGFAVWSATSLLGDETLQFKGEINSAGTNNSGKSITLFNSTTATHEYVGDNLVGNPYPSALNWNIDDSESTWDRSDIDLTYYVWNPSSGNYGSYTKGNAVGINGVDSIISAQQGFMVKCTSTSGTGVLSAKYDAQVHDNKAFFKSQIKTDENYIKLKITGNNFSDESMIRFIDNATDDFERNYDARKQYGLVEAPQLYSFDDETKFTNNSLPPTEEDRIVKIGFESGAAGLYTLEIVNLNWEGQSKRIYLEDLKEETFTRLISGQKYNLSYHQDDPEHRFNLHFKNDPAEDEFEVSSFNIYSFDKIIHIESTENINAEIAVNNMLGQEVMRTNMDIIADNKIDFPYSGNYVVSIVSDDLVTTKKIFMR